MFIQRLLTKCRSCSGSRLGHSSFGHQWPISSSRVLTGWWHDGQSTGMKKTGVFLLRSGSAGPDTWGMTSPARSMTTVSPALMSLPVNILFVVQTRALHGHSAHRDRLQHGDRSEPAEPPMA